jgi:hypothetical protein
MESGTTTATLSRMGEVDFSNPIWPDATAPARQEDVPARRNLWGLAGKSIAVVTGHRGETTQAVEKR